MEVVRGYSGDSRIWLIGDPDQVAKLAAVASLPLEITLQYQTLDLVFAIIQTK
jgi:hypothetical protein